MCLCLCCPCITIVQTSTPISPRICLWGGGCFLCQRVEKAGILEDGKLLEKMGPGSRLALERWHLAGAGLSPPSIRDSYCAGAFKLGGLGLESYVPSRSSQKEEAVCGLCPWSVSSLPPTPHPPHPYCLPIVSLAKYRVTSGTLPPSLSLVQYGNGFLYPSLVGCR